MKRERKIFSGRSNPALAKKIAQSADCELGDISSCRLAGRLAKDKTKQAYWYNKGCDLKDLDSCLEVDRLPGK